jgi:hypothetical protein
VGNAPLEDGALLHSPTAANVAVASGGVEPVQIELATAEAGELPEWRR